MGVYEQMNLFLLFIWQSGSMLNNPTGDLFMKQRTTEERGFVAFDDGL